jgi:hypothetical protein
MSAQKPAKKALESNPFHCIADENIVGASKSSKMNDAVQSKTLEKKKSHKG